MDSTAPQEKANGIATYFSVLTSPTAAFQQLARTPMWGWAALIGIVIMVAATIISFPEISKVAEIGQQHAISQMPADQQAIARQNIAAAGGITRGAIFVAPFVVAWIIWLLVALVYVIAAAITGANAKFSAAWVAAVNAAAVSFVVQLVNAVILALRGPDSISGPLDAYAIPSLGMLVHGNLKLAAFLNAYSIGYVWLYVVSAIALQEMLKMNRTAAIVTVVILSLLGGAVGAAAIR